LHDVALILLPIINVFALNIDDMIIHCIRRIKAGKLKMLMILYIVFMGCHNKKDVKEATYRYMSPVYSGIKLSATDDTIHFPLPNSTYNRIGVFNCFKEDSVTYISFFDRGSKSLNIYNFYSQELVKRAHLHDWVKNNKLDKASVFVKNFDSIYVTTHSSFYLLDSSGVIKSKVEFPEEFDKWGYISNIEPAVFKDNLTYIGVKPFINEKSVKAQRDWKPLYAFDMKNKTKRLFYSLPNVYQENLYGYAFLEYSYCINNKGNFVFSFAADENIYETNLSDYHIAYFGKSKFQKGNIEPVTREDLKRDDSYKFYCIRDSYGAIFFDPYRKRYLRMAKQRMSEAEFVSKTGRKKRSVIIFNENFQIIGESETNDEFSFDSIIFMDDGSIYARTNTKDERSLHFVRLTYQQLNLTKL